MTARPAPARLSVLSAGLLAACGPGCLGLTLGEWDFSRDRNPTLGQELLDLKAARDGGALTTAEYEQQRFTLLHPDGSGAVRVGG